MHDLPDLVIDGTYLGSGWPDLLPQQAMALHTLVRTATDHDVDGTIDELAGTLGVDWFEHFTGGLDCGVRWNHPLDEHDAEIVESGRRARLECIRAYSLSGIVLPATVRELARSMADLGILEVTGGGRRWRAVTWPPLPEEVLAVSDDFRDTQALCRWLMIHRPNARAILDFLPARTTFTVSVDELGRVVDLPEAAIRGGLELLVHDGALLLTNAQNVVVDPDTIAGDQLVRAFVRYDPFVETEEPTGLEYEFDFDSSPDFETLYELRFDEFDDPLTPRMAYLLWAAARWCRHDWRGSGAAQRLAGQLPTVAQSLSFEDAWARRFLLCFVHLESWLAGYQPEDVARCVGEQIAFHIVVDLAEAYAQDGFDDDEKILRLPDHGAFDLDFDRAREMLDDHTATMLLAPGFDVGVDQDSSLHPRRWFIPIGTDEDDWE